MRIKVKLHGILYDYRPTDSSGKVFELTVESGVDVRSIIEQIGIPQDALYLAFLDQRQVSQDTPVREGQILWLFPPVAGG